MKISFTAHIRAEGSFNVEDIDIEEAKAAGIDVNDRDTFADWLSEHYAEIGYLDEVVHDNMDYTDIDIQDWYVV